MQLLLCSFRSTPSKSYGERKNAGDLVASHGGAVGSWKSKRNGQNEIKIEQTDDSLQTRFKYMFQKLSDKAMGEGLTAFIHECNQLLVNSSPSY